MSIVKEIISIMPILVNQLNEGDVRLIYSIDYNATDANSLLIKCYTYSPVFEITDMVEFIYYENRCYRYYTSSYNINQMSLFEIKDDTLISSVRENLSNI